MPQLDLRARPARASRVHSGAPRGAVAVLLLSAACAAFILVGCNGDEPSPTPALPDGATVETTHYDPASRILRESEGAVHEGRRVGPWSFWHRNQKLARVGQYDAEGRETGEWVAFYPNEVPAQRASYVAGVLHGPFLEWHRNGTKRIVGRYVDGQQDGRWETFHENGAPDSLATFVAGVPDGPVLGWYPSGVERERLTFRNGARVGLVEAFHPNGQIEQRQQYDDQGRPTGHDVAWFEDGTPSMFVGYDDQGRRHGPHVALHAGGKLALRVDWEHGVTVGVERAWFPDGSLHYEVPNVDGERHGVLRSYHPDRSRQLVERWDRGARDGILRSWFPGGVPCSVQVYDAGVAAGLAQEWYADGRRKSYGVRRGEAHEGPVFEWSEDGSLHEELSARYEGGQRLPLTADDLRLAEELAADAAPRPVVANPEAPDAPYDPLPEAQRLEALPSELPLIPPFPEAAR